MIDAMIDTIATHASIIGLVFFFCGFLGIAFVTLKPANKETLEAHKHIPLAEE